jgi:GH25 family lysozyme M1 (1,4-beta-N-acetylmuramidase)
MSDIEKMSAGRFDQGEPEGESVAFATTEPKWTPKGSVIVDIYEGEYPVDLAGLMPFLTICRASAKFYDDYRREDRKVDDYVAECKQLGLRYGLYHFLLPNDITPQAELFLEVWNKLDGAHCRPIVDVECDPRKWDVGFSTWASHIKTWCDIVENEIDLKPIIYTSLYYWGYTGAPSWASEYDLWAAWYPYYPNNFDSLPSDRMPKGFSRLALWQYAEDGRTQGYLANDYNKGENWLLTEVEEKPT